MFGTKHILLIDDDRALRSTLAAALESEGGFRVSEACSAADAMRALSGHTRYDAVILDVALGDGDGCDLCLRLRRDGMRAPILMLSAVTSEQEVVRGLECGANDYMVKPFRLAELSARLRAQIRAWELSEDAVLPVGPYQFHPGRRQLHDPARNQRIRLTDKEAAVLKFLYRAGAEPVARQRLLHEVWGYSQAADSHTVETHIYRLRRKIELDAGSARIVVNIDG
ncbi:MAG: response regulator transcription factor, partial [Rhodospirillales bacterium]|nr:response regulator transcription factor [Rhodospirillales bacterium]